MFQENRAPLPVMIRNVDADSAQWAVMRSQRHVQIARVTLFPRATRPIEVGWRVVPVSSRDRGHGGKPVHVARKRPFDRFDDCTVSRELDPTINVYR